MTREEFYKALKAAENKHEQVLLAIDYNEEAEKIFRKHLPASFKEKTKQRYCAMLELLLYDYSIETINDPVGFDEAYLNFEDFMEYGIEVKKMDDTEVCLAMTVVNRLYQYMYEETSDVTYRRVHSRTKRIAHYNSYAWQVRGSGNKPKKRS